MRRPAPRCSAGYLAGRVRAGERAHRQEPAGGCGHVAHGRAEAPPLSRAEPDPTHPARRGVRGRAPAGGRQAGGHGGAPGAGARERHAGQRAAGTRRLRAPPAPTRAIRRGACARASCTASTRTPAACWWSPRTQPTREGLKALLSRHSVERDYLRASWWGVPRGAAASTRSRPPPAPIALRFTSRRARPASAP